MAKARSGFSIIEVLIALVIFATATLGLLFAMQGMTAAVVTAMNRDIEAAYANSLISEVNPYNPLVETEYDVTSKTALNLPNGETVYYTRIVDSDALTADVKNINVYLFRESTSTTPYRKFRKEVAVEQGVYFNNIAATFSSAAPTPYYRDVLGRTFFRHTTYFSGSYQYSGTAGSRRSGFESAILFNCGDDGIVVASSPDPEIFKYHCSQNSAGSSGNPLNFKFLATSGQKYTLEIGMAHYTGFVPGSGVLVNVWINGSQIDQFDALETVGPTANVAAVKLYSVTGVDDSGVGTVTLGLENDAASTGTFQSLTYILLKRANI